MSLTIGAVVAALVLKGAERTGEQAIESGWSAIGKLVDRARRRFQEAGDEAAEAMLARVDDPPVGRQQLVALAAAVDRYAGQDPEFAMELRRLVDEGRSAGVDVRQVTQMTWGPQVTGQHQSITIGRMRDGQVAIGPQTVKNVRRIQIGTALGATVLAVVVLALFVGQPIRHALFPVQTPSTVGVPGNDASTTATYSQLPVPQAVEATVVQHVLTETDESQRNGEVTFTTKVTSAGHTGGRPNTGADYALNRVAASQAFVRFAWHFTDGVTRTDLSGSTDIQRIHFTSQSQPLSDADVSNDIKWKGMVSLSFAYRETDQTGGARTDYQDATQDYSVLYQGSRIDVEPSSCCAAFRVDKVRVPVEAITQALRNSISVPEDVTVTDPFEDAHATTWTYHSTAVVPCTREATGTLTLMLSTTPSHVWVTITTDSAVSGPGTYAAKTDAEMLGIAIETSVVVDPGGRTGSVSGHSTDGLGGAIAVSGRWMCQPIDLTLDYA